MTAVFLNSHINSDHVCLWLLYVLFFGIIVLATITIGGKTTYPAVPRDYFWLCVLELLQEAHGRPYAVMAIKSGTTSTRLFCTLSLASII